MKVHLHRVELPLEHHFTIARGTLRVQQCLIVELEDKGLRGYGEATSYAYDYVTQDPPARTTFFFDTGASLVHLDKTAGMK